MSKINQLVDKDPSDYNETLFFEAVNEALEKWRKNDLYKRKLESSEFESVVESWEDIRDLPTIDMREFKTHPKDLAIVEPDPEKAYYSSGTTSDNKSFAPRTNKGIRRERVKTKRFLDELIGEVDYSKVLALPEEELNKLPTDMARRGIFRKILWSKPNKSEYYLEIKEGDMRPDFQGLAEDIKQEDGSGILQGATTQVHDFCNYLHRQNEDINLGSNGKVLVSGGWKGQQRKTKSELRSDFSESLGVKEENVLDIFGTTELTFVLGNKLGKDDPERKRIPSQAYVYVADEETFHQTGQVQKVDEGKEGFLVIVDPTNPDYPGVILADDIVRKHGGPYGEESRIEYVGRAH